MPLPYHLLEVMDDTAKIDEIRNSKLIFRRMTFANIAACTCLERRSSLDFLRN
jgi:hypothetical protein